MKPYHPVFTIWNKLLRILSIITLSVIAIACSRKAEEIEFQNSGINIDVTNSLIESDTIWKDIFKGDTIDYYVSSMVRIIDADLIIAPGVKISFEDSLSGIRVEGSGSLTAAGTDDDSIVFTSRNANYGNWMGIIFASDNPKNELSRCIIEHGGFKADEGFTDEPALIGISKEPGTQATISHCLLTYSSHYGLWVAPTADIRISFKNNLLDLSFPINLPANKMGQIDSTNEFTYNYTYIDVYGPSGEITQSDTIMNPGIPFRIEGKIFVSSELYILPGCNFQFDSIGELITSKADGSSYNGTIIANGTENNKIVFTSLYNNTNYSWVGITITSGNANSFLHCDVSNAGQGHNFDNPDDVKGNFVVGQNGIGAKATIKYCTISNSKGYGIARQSESTIYTADFRYVGNIIIRTETNNYLSNTLDNIGTY